jgi:hypothetical protein
MYGGSASFDNDDRNEAVRKAVERARAAARERSKQLGGAVDRRRSRSRSAERKTSSKVNKRDARSRSRSNSTDRLDAIRNAIARARAAALQRATQLGGANNRNRSRSRSRSQSRERKDRVERDDVNRNEAIRRAIERARSAALERVNQFGGNCGLQRDSERRDSERRDSERRDSERRDLEGGSKLRRAMEELRDSLKGGKKGKKALKKYGKKASKKVVKASKVRKVLKARLRAKTRGQRKPCDRTYVAFVARPGSKPMMLRSPVGDKAKIYLHGLPGAAAKKVLTALTRKRKVSRGKYVSIAAKGAYNGPSKAVRITLVEVTKGLVRSAPKATGGLSLASVEKGYFQYHYYGWNVPVKTHALTLKRRDKKTDKVVSNTFKPLCKHVVVRATKKASSLAAAVAKAKVKANRSKAALAKGRKMNKMSKRK